jgi:hypothetical protein
MLTEKVLACFVGFEDTYDRMGTAVKIWRWGLPIGPGSAHYRAGVFLFGPFKPRPVNHLGGGAAPVPHTFG